MYYSKLSVTFKVNRKLFVKADAYELQNLLGFKNGGIAPISLSENVEAVFSDKIVKDSVIYCGSGARTLEVKSKDIIN